MKSLVRKLLSQQVINNFYHLPKAILANFVYGFPTSGMTVIGITGTDGKTTTTNMIYHILKAAGKKVSMVSTINAVIAGKAYDTGFHVTSPDPLMVQKFARQAKDHRDQYLVLEVTSHALDQYRFWGVKFTVGVITNITHEHLDYHKTWQNYLQTKLKLLKGVKFAIINYDLLNFVMRSHTKLSTFGLDKGDFNHKKFSLKLKIPGSYNVENALAAMAVTICLGVDRDVAKKAIEQFRSLSGRLEEIKNSRRIRVIVDFAHTPNALEQTLKTLRKQTKGKLISVFGSAGQRDVAKRALMGEVSGKLADYTVITAEDPRGELEQINRQIISGAKKAGGKLDQNLFVIDDRGVAIDFAINKLAKRGDIVGIFGKGHEKSLNLDGIHEIHWSDQEAARKALKSGYKNKTTS